MADWNIASMGAKMQAFIEKFKLDENGDGLINEGEKKNLVSKLLSGDANFKVGDQLEINSTKSVEKTEGTSSASGPKNSPAPLNPLDILAGIENYNNISPEQREELLGFTAQLVISDIELVNSKINQVIEEWGTNDIDPMPLYSKLALEQTDVDYEDLKNSLDEVISHIQDKMQDSMQTIQNAFDHYNSNGVYTPVAVMFSVQDVLEAINYETMDDFINDMKQRGHDGAVMLLTEFLNKAKEISTNYMQNEIRYADSKLRSYVLEDCESLNYLNENTKENGISSLQDLEDNLENHTKKIFYRILIDANEGQFNSLEEVAVKENKTRKFVETAPDGSKRIVIQNEEGKKFDLSGKEITD